MFADQQMSMVKLDGLLDMILHSPHLLIIADECHLLRNRAKRDESGDDYVDKRRF